jgi:IS5 family transposase
MAMIVDRYDAMNLFELVPQLKLAMEPVLAELDVLLEDDAVFRRVKADLGRRYPQSLTRGRPSTPVEVILRMLVVRRLYDWTYEETEQFVGDSLVLRQFCRLYLAPAPDDTTLIRWAGLIGPTTLENIHERVVALARQAHVTRGRKLRTDGTVVGATIHHPTDSSLLADGVRVLSRLVGRARVLIAQSAEGGRDLFRDRTRSAKRWARRIAETARQHGEAAAERRSAAYEHLVTVTEASLQQAAQVLCRLGDLRTDTADALRGQVAHFVPLVEQVLEQACRRVFAGESVPAGEKLVSIFEPHVQIIRRGQLDQPTEFGRKVWLDEVDGGIISRYRALAGNPADSSQAAPALAHHQRVFGRAPEVFAGDRGVATAENELTARQLGVKRVALPRAGAASAERRAYERQGWFRRAQRFRAGMEGRISVMRRRGYLGRCRDHGEDGFERWVGWGVIAANLATIARRRGAHAC